MLFDGYLTLTNIHTYMQTNCTCLCLQNEAWLRCAADPFWSCSATGAALFKRLSQQVPCFAWSNIQSM